MSNAPPICGRCRIGSSGLRSRACRASPELMPSAATSSSTRCNPTRPKLIALGLSFADVAKAIEANNVSRGASAIERNGEGIVVRTGGRLENVADISECCRQTRGAYRFASATSPAWRSAVKSAPAAPAKTAMRPWSAPPSCLSAATAAPSQRPSMRKLKEIRQHPAARRGSPDRPQPHPVVDATVLTVATNLGEGALLVILVLFACSAISVRRSSRPWLYRWPC